MQLIIPSTIVESREVSAALAPFGRVTVHDSDLPFPLLRSNSAVKRIVDLVFCRAAGFISFHATTAGRTQNFGAAGWEATRLARQTLMRQVAEFCVERGAGVEGAVADYGVDAIEISGVFDGVGVKEDEVGVAAGFDAAHGFFAAEKPSGVQSGHLQDFERGETVVREEREFQMEIETGGGAGGGVRTGEHRRSGFVEKAREPELELPVILDGCSLRGRDFLREIAADAHPVFADIGADVFQIRIILKLRVVGKFAGLQSNESGHLPRAGFRESGGERAAFGFVERGGDVSHASQRAWIKENLGEKRIDGEFADEEVHDETRKRRRLLHRMSGGFPVERGFVGGAGGEDCVAGAKMFDGTEAGARGLEGIDAGLEMAFKGQADFFGFDADGEKSLRRNERDFDEVRALRFLAIDFGDGRFRSEGVGGDEDFAGHGENLWREDAGEEAIFAALLEQRGASGHLAEGGDAVREHQRFVIGGVRRAEDVNVGVHEAGHEEFSLCVDDGRGDGVLGQLRGIRSDGRDFSGSDGDGHVRSTVAVMGVNYRGVREDQIVAGIDKWRRNLWGRATEQKCYGEESEKHGGSAMLVAARQD